jgi:hypothetical protein
MNDREDNETTRDNEPRDRARRRLIKLGIYLAPAVISMTTFLRKSDARPQVPQVTPGSGSSSTANPDSQVMTNPQ